MVDAGETAGPGAARRGRARRRRRRARRRADRRTGAGPAPWWCGPARACTRSSRAACRRPASARAPRTCRASSASARRPRSPAPRWPRGPRAWSAAGAAGCAPGLLAVDDVRLNGDPDARIPGHVQVSAGWVEGESLCLALAARGRRRLAGVGLHRPRRARRRRRSRRSAWSRPGPTRRCSSPCAHTTTEDEVDLARRGLRRVGGRAARDEPAAAVSARIVDALGTWCPVPIHLIDRAARRARRRRGHRAARRRPADRDRPAGLVPQLGERPAGAAPRRPGLRRAGAGQVIRPARRSMSAWALWP